MIRLLLMRLKYWQNQMGRIVDPYKDNDKVHMINGMIREIKEQLRAQITHRSVDHALYQAQMWRKHVKAWDSPFHSWEKNILRVSREDCLRNAQKAAFDAAAIHALRA